MLRLFEVQRPIERPGARFRPRAVGWFGGKQRFDPGGTIHWTVQYSGCATTCALKRQQDGSALHLAGKRRLLTLAGPILLAPKLLPILRAAPKDIRVAGLPAAL